MTAPPSTPPAPGGASPSPAPPPPDAEIGGLEKRLREVELKLLDKESRVQDLEGRLAAQQRMLDEAIQEVVRGKAKLLSLESRAEAASQMAETEIALKALEDQAAGEQDADLAQIRNLIEMSGAEFEKSNFGGALYLTIQAKSRIQAAQMRLQSLPKGDAGAGETLFAAPLMLEVIKSANLRMQPDLASRVLVTLPPRTTVTGYSHRGEWVRVTCADGTRGWIHQSLLRTP